MLFVARHRGRIVGALTLVAFRIPTGVRTRIEDVVVDETMRAGGWARCSARLPSTGPGSWEPAAPI